MGKKRRPPKKNPRKCPPHPDDPRTQTMLFYAQPGYVKRAHRQRERYAADEQRPDLVYELVRRYGYRCLHCGDTRQLRLDHIIPVSKGGRTELNNLQLLCADCDLAKGTQIIDYRGGKELCRGN